MPECSLESLALRLRDGKGDSRKPPRFALFLGAGASVESGIPGTTSMMETFRKKLRERWDYEGKKGEFEDWLKRQPQWKNDASEYSNLFEVFEPTHRGRARHVQELLAGHSPGFGYFCLSQLLSQGFIDVVVTTNFDDLVYEACTQWTGVRPRVYAYGAPGGPVRREPGRPSILKLHGDFLYSVLKNTDDEDSLPDPNMEEAVRRLQDDYDVIVVGYGGCDESIMRLFEGTPREAGLYWCVYKDGPLSDRVTTLLAKGSRFAVRTDGFYYVMDTFLHAAGFKLPKQDDLRKQVEDQSQAIVKIISDSTSRHKDDYLGQAQQQSPEAWQQAFIAGYRAYEREEYDEAIAAYRKALELRPDDSVIPFSLGVALRGNGQYEEAIAAFRKSLEVRPDDSGTLHGLGMTLFDNGQYEEAIAVYRKSLELMPNSPGTLNNLGSVLLEKGQVDEAIAMIQKSLDLRAGHTSTLDSMGVALTLGGRSDLAIATFEQVIRSTAGKSPADGETQANRGVALLGARHSEQGVAVFKQLISRRPIPKGCLRNTLPAIKNLAKAGLAGAAECVALIEDALGHPE